MKCRKKKKHPGLTAAKEARERILFESCGKVKLWVYSCPTCNFWHLTKMMQKKNERYGLV